MTRRVLLVIAAAIVLGGMIAAVVLWKPSDPAPTEATTPTPSAAATAVGISDQTLADLSDRLTSSDSAVLAEAVGVDPADVPPEVQAAFPTLDIVFDSSSATASGGAWVVHATVTQDDGTVTRWAVTIADSPTGLIFIDSMQADGSEQ